MVTVNLHDVNDKNFFYDNKWQIMVTSNLQDINDKSFIYGDKFHLL